MAEFKKVFDLVTREIIEQDLTVDEFIAWLATQRKGGEVLENWSAEDIAVKIREFKDQLPEDVTGPRRRMSNTQSVDSDDDAECQSQQPADKCTASFIGDQLHQATVVK